MVQVKSSLGGNVEVEIKGIAETLEMLRRKNIQIKQGADLGTLRAANFIQSEIQESIIGNRSEPKSVATGRFANSISTKKNQDANYSVYPEKSEYPDSPGTTTEDVALKLEYGTSSTAPRMHFRNSASRSKTEAIQIIKKEVESNVGR